VAGHYQPLADNVTVAVTSDHTCLPQSNQKAKQSRHNQLCFDLCDRSQAASIYDTGFPPSRERRCAYFEASW